LVLDTSIEKRDGHPVTRLPSSPALRSIAIVLLSCVSLSRVPSAEPLVIDLGPRYTKRYDAKDGPRFKPIAGRQTVDGLPFDISGEVHFFGRTAAERVPDGKYERTIKGLVVGRRFDELHLVHFTHWWDVEGRTLAKVALNYEDGTRIEIPLRYGGHVRDGSRLLTEEKELLTDPGTKVFWRGEGNTRLKATDRLFKSLLPNPHPEKIVQSLDFDAEPGCLASYALMAATVADHDEGRKQDAPVPPEGPEREFVGQVVVRVLDAMTSKPIEGALVQTSEKVDDAWLVATPAFTNATGEMTLRYPPGRTAWIRLDPEKEHYKPAQVFWDNDLDFPAEYVFFLWPE